MAGFGKFDSDYSALKALAYSVGVTTPENGWDSSYSIMASMYEHLVGAPVEIGTPMTAMLTEIAEGAESGEIVISDGCINEIERLNELLRTKENEIGSLTDQLEDAANNADVALFGSIGYTRENASHFFDAEKEALEYAKKIQDEWVWTNILTNHFVGDKKLVYMPLVNTTGVTNMREMFRDCTLLQAIPLLDTSSVTNTYNLFRACVSLQSIPRLDTSSVTNMESMFQDCVSLQSIPQLNTSSVKGMPYMFYGCKSLISIPQLDTSKVTDIREMFRDCTSLTTIPQLDTSSVTNMNGVFYTCTSLTTIPQLDTSSATNMIWMFNGCTSLTTIPQLDTSKVTDVSNMFNSCTKLESLPLLDFSSVTNIAALFGYGNINTLTDLGGFTGLKINWTSYGSLKQAPNLTVQSLLNVFNTIADVNDLGGRTLEMGTTNLNKLTDEQKAIATAKGWSLT